MVTGPGVRGPRPVDDVDGDDEACIRLSISIIGAKAATARHKPRLRLSEGPYEVGFC